MPLSFGAAPTYIATMSLHLRSLLLTALIALGLVISGQAAALAKGASPATGYMVLCTGHGLVVLFTDENGEPTAAPHLCPDCTLSALTADPGASTDLAAFDANWDLVDWPASTVVAASEPTTPTHARGPPLSV